MKIKKKSSTDYFCEVQVSNTNIKQIILQPSFNFVSQGKILLVGISPIAKISINDLKKIDNKFNNLLSSNPDLFILDNSIIDRYENRKFNISGIINRDKPKSLIVNNYLTFMSNIEGNDNKLTNEFKCITSIKNNNYSLNCEIIDEYIYNLQSSVSTISDGILVLNFPNAIYENKNARINYQKYEDGGQYYGYIQKEETKSGGINYCIIIGIILASIVVIAITIGAIIYFKKRGAKKFNNKPTSSLQDLETFK